MKPLPPMKTMIKINPSKPDPPEQPRLLLLAADEISARGLRSLLSKFGSYAAASWQSPPGLHHG